MNSLCSLHCNNKQNNTKKSFKDTTEKLEQRGHLIWDILQDETQKEKMVFIM